jgi:Mrp family chromosome partitioning ATPase/O-antigen ligase
MTRASGLAPTLVARLPAVVACAVLAAAVAALAALAGPERYEAEARLVFRPSQLDALLVGQGSWRKVDPARIAASRASLLGAGAVAARAARVLPGDPDPRSLDRAVHVAPVAGTDVAVVTAVAPDPRRAAAIANAYADAAKGFVVHEQRARIDAARTLLARAVATAPADELPALRETAARLQLLHALQVGEVQVLDRATVPPHALPDPLTAALLGGLLGLLGGIALVLALARLDRRPHGHDELERALSAPVLGSVPASDGNGDGPYRLLREQLRAGAGPDLLRSLAISTPHARDGRSTVALNLARSWAQGGDRVILVDADLRHGDRAPSAHAHGLSRMLAHGGSVADELVDGGQDGRLLLLPAGAAPPNTPDLLRSERMAGALREASDLAQLVIVDAPPVLPSSDTAALLGGGGVDGVLLVGRGDGIVVPRLRDARRLLERTPARVLGVVLEDGPRRGPRARRSELLTAPPRALVATLVVLLALLVGVAAAHAPVAGAVVVALGLGAIALVALGEAALPAGLVLVAALPYYDLQSGFRGGTLIPTGAIAVLALLVPAAVLGLRLARGEGRRAGPLTVALVLLFALAFALTLLDGGGSIVREIIPAAVFGGALAYLAARRAPALAAWPWAAAAGLLLLLGVGLLAAAADPGGRLGAFTGYPILFGGLVVALLPLATLALWRVSPLAGGAVAALAVLELVLSQTRSAWLGVAVSAAVGSLLLWRVGRLRALGVVAAAAVALVVLVLADPTARSVVEERLATQNVAGSISYSHRRDVWDIAGTEMRGAPLLGEQTVGASKDVVEQQTGIDAPDDGVLALAIDLGLVGIVLALAPALVLLAYAARAWRRRAAAAEEIALAMGLTALIVLTLFFDVHYWPQSALLLYGMAGVLSTR